VTDIVTIKPRKVTSSVLINVHHWSGDTSANSVRIESETPLGAFAVGDRVWIGGLEGYPESRLTMGRVRGIKHTLSGDKLNFRHEIVVAPTR
jgi:hypothetical protein